MGTSTKSSFILETCDQLRLEDVKLDRQSHNDASTFHDTWMKVDYIFYSTKILPSGETREGRLRLLGRFSLPNRQQMALVGKIPNHQCPSDHLPLVAEFLLLQVVYMMNCDKQEFTYNQIGSVIIFQNEVFVLVVVTI